MTEPTSLRDKVVLVTGASSGIGRAIALDLAEEGVKLVICARREPRLEALAAEAKRMHGIDVLPVPCNLRNTTDIARLFEAIRTHYGGVDILVNNAGLGRHAPLMSGATEDWREMLELNVLALCMCTREAVSDMRRRGDQGHVVHISSMAGYRTPLESGVYSATKFAVRALTEGLRQELRAAQSRVRVSAISPGFVETEFAEVYAHGDADAKERTYSKFPVLQPRDIARAVRFVLSSPPYMQVHDLLVRPTEQPN
jgi:17beta-estradiol 17-dehydrogenase / 3beta-hydroxysteroid 3-dehydrogenase